MTTTHLYPPIEPYDQGTLAVDDWHTLYYEQSGNPKGKAVLFIHGGPGGGTDANARRFFDPKAYRIILVDQRGCGQSTPHASLRDNTTWHLVRDFEQIRQHLNIERWQLFGGSWGSALALAYAQTHPEVVSELIIRGIFLVREQELHWFYQHGASQLFPDEWEQFIAPIPEHERDTMIETYYRQLTHDDPGIQTKAAKAWTRWEASTLRLQQDTNAITKMTQTSYAQAFARIECHYFINKAFFTSENHPLARIDRIRHIPGTIVQGRYDVICPMQSAWELHRAWPEADFHIIPGAGHSAYESGIAQALVNATNRARP